MTKKKSAGPSNRFVSGEVLKEIQSCRPLRLFIKKQRKKGNETPPFALRSEFLQTSPEKQLKYFQKAIDKYIQLLDEKDIDERAQIEGQLLENVLSKREQKIYFESLNAPKKPLYNAAAYYAEINKQEHNENAKAWKLLTPDEKKPYTQMLNDAKEEYTAQVKNFTENLPDRLKCEYLSLINPTQTAAQGSGESTTSESIKQRRKSVQPLPENFQPPTNETTSQKLTRTQLDDLHKCQPSILYYENKVSDDEKPTFANTTAKNTYIRSLFNQLSEKKRHKFILKATKQWEEYLQLHPAVPENQIPTLHLLLSKNDDIHYYFSTLGLPTRPPISALYLYGNERQQTGSQQNWADLSQGTKDEYIKRLTKIKAEYHQNLVEFVEKTLPSDYIRLEFFRNVKFASKDYEAATKDRVPDKDEGQLKITQYLKPKKPIDSGEMSEFDRIKQQLLATSLTNEQKKLVDRLGQVMKKYLAGESTDTKKSSSGKDSAKPVSSHRASTTSNEVVLINGDVSADDVEPKISKNKKKRKHEKDDADVENITSTKSSHHDQGKQSSTSSSMKKRK
ncbi:unnamed protein product [Adineta ricciae]|uniref:HMG box domain-containing protein n=1 Tax=Adineta ricciae TaxID=249248 RepID=A0A813ZR42_ADIRI|nr:unnamed protein product [Adineta ricciae]CAF1156436.1 unnamed protein product [Adineta ricciae]